MRQGQQNRRGRGRNNQNNQQRKGQNPLTRSFESNGPDVKLRGTPAHIAEKYMSLARDAQSAGDPVLAENYLQHAEHYNRIIMAYREQQISQGEAGYSGGYNPQHRAEGGFGPETEGEEAFDAGSEHSMMPRQGGDQPRTPDGGGERRFEDRPHRMHGEPRHQQHGQRDRDRDRSFQSDRGGYDRRDRQERVDRFDRGDRPDRNDRPDRSERFDRGERQDRGERPERPEHRVDRDRPERFERPQPAANDVRGNEPRSDAPPRRRERPVSDRLPSEAHEQPEFLRRPVRRPRREEHDEGVVSVPAAAIAGSDDSE
jgi:hypothetical protein